MGSDAPARVADLGCGTASVTVLPAADGYEVHGVDLSAAMATGRADGTHLPGRRRVPPLAPGTFDVVFVRHVLWVLPDPGAVVRR